jgi:hypothetical protein
VTPRRVRYIGSLVAGELVGANDDGIVYLERAEATGVDGGVVGFGLKNGARKEKLFGKLLVPLLAEVGRRDDEDAPFALRPLLGNDEARLDGFTQTDLVGEQRALRQRRVKRKQGGIDLMRIQIHLRACNRTGEFLRAIGGAPLG